jgi:hypothetical protein
MKAQMKVAKAQTKTQMKTFANAIVDIVRKRNIKNLIARKKKHEKCTKNCSKNNRCCKKNTNAQAHIVIKKL